MLPEYGGSKCTLQAKLNTESMLGKNLDFGII